MFHVELRQFPHVARAFNWSREEVDGRILRPLASGRPVELNDRRWSPEKVKVAVYEAPELEIEEIGLGRGWGNVTRTGENVTERLLSDARQAVAAPPALAQLKQAILERCAPGPLGYEQLLDLAADIATGADASETVELAMRAVWELLQEGALAIAAS